MYLIKQLFNYLVFKKSAIAHFCYHFKVFLLVNDAISYAHNLDKLKVLFIIIFTQNRIIPRWKFCYNFNTYPNLLIEVLKINSILFYGFKFHSILWFYVLLCVRSHSVSIQINSRFLLVKFETSILILHT